MKIELVQVGRWRQVVQDRHLLERKDEEERLRSKVAEVRSHFYILFWISKEFVVCVKESCFSLKSIGRWGRERRGLWHKLSNLATAPSHFPPIQLSDACNFSFNCANFIKNARNKNLIFLAGAEMWPWCWASPLATACKGERTVCATPCEPPLSDA